MVSISPTERPREVAEPSGRKGPSDPKAGVVVPVVLLVPVAVRRPWVCRIVVPGTAADDTFLAIPCRPRKAIGGRPVVVLMPAILHPLPHIAGHIVEAERIGLERSDRRGSQFAPLVFAAMAVGVFFVDLVAPVKGRRGASTSRVFPFGFGEQPVFLAGHLAEPRHICLGVVPVQIDDRSVEPSPAVVVGP